MGRASPGNRSFALYGGDLIESLIPFTLLSRQGMERVNDVSEGMAQALDRSQILAPDAQWGQSASYTAVVEGD